MYGNFRPATLDDYIEWLKGCIKKGDAPTHYYDYPFSRANFQYVAGGFGLQGECGAKAHGIIVAPGATLDPRGSKFGHNTLYYMAGHTSEDRNGSPALWVPVYNDNAFLSIRGIDTHIRRLVAKNEQDSRELRKPRKDDPLSSANDHWTGDPVTDRMMMVERARQARS